MSTSLKPLPQQHLKNLKHNSFKYDKKNTKQSLKKVQFKIPLILHHYNDDRTIITKDVSLEVVGCQLGLSNIKHIDNRNKKKKKKKTKTNYQKMNRNSSFFCPLVCVIERQSISIFSQTNKRKVSMFKIIFIHSWLGCNGNFSIFE